MPVVASAGTPELQRALRAVKRAGRGGQVAAFFDYDGTVIGGYSASAFYEHRIRHREIGPIELARTLLARRRGIHSGHARISVTLEIYTDSDSDSQRDALTRMSDRLFGQART